ncbi:DNA primase [Candidatus Poribacteria bacterium]|nr:DNA primase [Candidatus Poribacteria bacterium]
MVRLETKILSHLVSDEDFCRKTVPFIKEEYFHDNIERILFKKISEFFSAYNNIPTKEALVIELDNDSTITDEEYQTAGKILGSFTSDIDDQEWLLDKTESFCKDKAIYNAIMESISIIDGKSQDKSTHELPTILSDALAVSFDSHIGHDFLDDYEDRYEFYHRTEERIPFDLEYFNRITKGGLPRKSLNIILAGTGVGKSLAMCHMAAGNLNDGKNVLYITLEMAEEKIAERIDANLLNVAVEDLVRLSKDDYDKKVNRVKDMTAGKLIIKEYPTASAGAAHFRHLINELKIKRRFEPDIIYIDYLNIATSTRVKPGANVNTYVYVKAIAEELRGLAVEKNVPVVSATQTTRSGFTNSDPGLEDTSESFGLPATADFMVAIITNDELEDLNQFMVKQLKNRYNDPTMYKRFVVGVDRNKMRLYDAEESAQSDIVDAGPVMDHTEFGMQLPREKPDVSSLLT